MFDKTKIYSSDEIFRIKNNGTKVFEINHETNRKQLGGCFDRYKIIKEFSEVREIEPHGSLSRQDGAIIVEMVNPEN